MNTVSDFYTRPVLDPWDFAEIFKHDAAPVCVDRRKQSSADALRHALKMVAPGTELRAGLERVLRGCTGALVVLGNDATVEHISSGGFVLDVDFSATRLRELCKMDGAVILNGQATRICRASAELSPDPAIETTESGTRHRTAERVAKQTGFPVISVSKSLRIIELYVNARHHVLEKPEAVLARANQALAMLERYRERTDMVHSIVEEIETYVLELGADGRLFQLQLDEIIGATRLACEFVPEPAVNRKSLGREY